MTCCYTVGGREGMGKWRVTGNCRLKPVATTRQGFAFCARHIPQGRVELLTLADISAEYAAALEQFSVEVARFWRAQSDHRAGRSSEAEWLVAWARYGDAERMRDEAAHKEAGRDEQ